MAGNPYPYVPLAEGSIRVLNLEPAPNLTEPLRGRFSETPLSSPSVERKTERFSGRSAKE